MLETLYRNIGQTINYSRFKIEPSATYDFHLHNRFEIYFFISGDVNYFIEKKMYPLKYGDLLIINSHEIHRPTFLSKNTYERITIHFEPQLLRLLNSPDFNLLNCFENRPTGELNKINLTPVQLEEVLLLLYKIESLQKTPSEGSDILIVSSFMELLVLINRIFTQTQPLEDTANVPEKLIPVLDYIDSHLDTDLSLAFLESTFYLNRFYLSRLFKKSTGSSIHEYILFKRISKAKKLLSSGLSVTESCMLSGFSDYSNFIRMFKKTTGFSPGQYSKKYPSDEK